MPITTAVVGRQPIVDRDRTLIGYELLFRALETSESAFDSTTSSPAGEITAPITEGDAMSTAVFFSTMDIGVARTVGTKTIFCNADYGVLTRSVEITLPPLQTVVEVLENVHIDDAVLAGCRSLRQDGYRLAADDFCWFPGAEKLLELVDIVKIDLRAMSPEEVGALMERCRPFGVQLLAEKVETDEEFAHCLDLGFDLFQGYLLGRPDTVSSPALGPSRAGTLRMASALMRADTGFDQLEQILRSEPALAYRLLQLAAIGRLGEFKRQIRSIREALVTVGLTRIRGWLPALLLRPTGPAIDTSLPGVLARARLAEILATRLCPEQAGFAFAAGKLSAFDLLLGVPREELPELLEVPKDLRDAAFDGTTGVGRLVSAVIRYHYDQVVPEDLPGVDQTVMDTAAAQAFSWAVQMVEGLD